MSEVLDSAAGFWRMMQKGYQIMREDNAFIIRVGAYVN